MKKIVGLCLLAATSMVCGIKYDGLRVKFGWSDALADREYFFKIPRTNAEAEAEGWRRTPRSSGTVPDLRMYCLPGRYVCPMYDVTGFVAGLQIGLPVDDFESLPIKPERKMLKYKLPATLLPEREPAREYWFLPQYFVSQESLIAGDGPTIENGATLQDGGVWVNSLKGPLEKIPSSEAELNTTLYLRQNCIPNMGTHYYYNMTPAMKCENIQPWFVLTSGGEMVGTGFQMFGRLTKQMFREWFEVSPSPKRAVEMAIPNAPTCYGEWAQSYGMISIHIYYVDKPWNIRCKDGDSIKPPPALDKLLLNGYRYASTFSDEMKRLFSG